MYDGVEVAIRVCPRLVIRQGWWYSRVGYSRRWTRNFQRRFYLCHSTRSVNTRSVNTRSNWIWDSRSANALVHLLPLLHLHQGFQPYYARQVPITTELFRVSLEQQAWR